MPVENSQNVKNIEQLDRFAERPLDSFKWFIPYLILPWNHLTAKTSWKYIHTVLKDFFSIQFLRKFNITHIPIVNVQDPLDDNVPFTPAKIDIYMHFVNFWISPVTMLFSRFKFKKALLLSKEFLGYITLAYKEASRVYYYRLSTTDRPNYKKNAKFRSIHALDPHYLCVPSLHVSIVVLCFSFYKMIFERENFTQKEKDNWNKELYKGAIEITESVLFVKQHSVNCIPAALYMMTRILPFFSTDEAVAFIDNLFKSSPEITEEKRIQVINHIQYMYERLVLEGCNEEDWAVPVQRWLERQQEKNNKAKELSE